MTTQEKELLLKVLCAMLPYGVKCRLSNSKASIIEELKIGGLSAFMNGDIEVLPYLRPLSSMTEEEKEEYTSYCFEQPFLQKDKTPNLGSVPMCIDWLIANHFDYRGLIPMGLALEAPKGMYKEVEL